MKTYISEFCRYCDYPAEAEAGFLAAWDTIMANREAADTFLSCIEEYDRLGVEFNYGENLRISREAGVSAGVHEYISDLLYAICLCRHMKELYDLAGLPEELYKTSVFDLKYKLFECKKVYDIWGSFVAGWFGGFFYLKRFAFGRLQLELETYRIETPYTCAGVTVQKGDKAVNMHIPSAGPLLKEDCMESFRQAYKYFRPMFDNDKIPFVCYSWLLYREHYEFLPEKSRIRDFMDFFDIEFSKQSPVFGDCWRIFNRKYEGSLEGFPNETSLQRAYLDWYAKGGVAGCGEGVFIFDGEKIHHKND